MRKTSSFTLSRPPSMKQPNKLSPPLPNIEYPTSPDFVLAQEMTQSSHHRHPLSHVSESELFTCSGCKEYGSGYRFACKLCDFQLHEFCALAPSVLQAHPFHIHHQFTFYSKPVKNGILKSKCDVCGKATKGYSFRCNACSYQMHPCCAMLSNEINISVHPHALRLMPGAGINGGSEASFACGECNRKRSGRVYRCSVCEYHLHAVCAKDMVNGLQANGWKGHGQKPSMLGKAARLASQVVIEFIGGIMEGLGEGVGQMFIQTIARGRRPTPNRITAKTPLQRSY